MIVIMHSERVGCLWCMVQKNNEPRLQHVLWIINVTELRFLSFSLYSSPSTQKLELFLKFPGNWENLLLATFYRIIQAGGRTGSKIRADGGTEMCHWRKWWVASGTPKVGWLFIHAFPVIFTIYNKFLGNSNLTKNHVLQKLQLRVMATVSERAS